MGESDSLATKRISADGVCRNGVSVVALIRFIRAYNCEARIDDVAKYFHLEIEDVAAALAFYAEHFDRVHPLVVAGER